MDLTEHKPGSVLSLPTPLARLYGTAMKLGIEVRDFPCEGVTGDDDITAVVVCGATIALNPAIEDDDLRADVLAMALEITAVMTNRETSDPGEVYAPGGFVLITINRIPAPETGPGALATAVARRCGRDTASAAFEFSVPHFEFYAPEFEFGASGREFCPPWLQCDDPEFTDATRARVLTARVRGRRPGLRPRPGSARRGEGLTMRPVGMADAGVSS